MGIQSLAGQSIGQYELQELLGIGGMGAVYRAFQPSLKRSVAIKILTPALAQQPGYLERFNREAETAAGLEHSHIVPIYDHGTENGASYVVMRYLTGGTLADRMRRHKDQAMPMPSLGEVAELLEQLGSALDYAHSQGIVHRDIKPSNVMFDEHGNAYIVDFGIAKLIDTTESLTGTGVSMGTPAYMAPEQWKGEPVGPATDQYALGVMTYALCTGHPPFEAPTPYALMHKHLNEKPIPPHYQRTDLPPTATLVLERALAKAPEDRYPAVSDFAEAFRGAIEGSTGEQTGFFTVPVSPQPTPIGPLTPPSGVSGRRSTPTAARRVQRGWALGAALGALALLIGAAALALLLDDDPSAPTDIAGEQTRVALSAVALAETQLALETLAVEQTQAAISATGTAIAAPGTPQTEGEALLLTATALSLLEPENGPEDTPTAMPTATPTITPTSAPTETPVPSETPTLRPSSTPIAVLSPTPLALRAAPTSAAAAAGAALPGPTPSEVAVPAGCRAAGIEPPTPTTADQVVIIWSWSASRRALLQDHIERARYEVELDGRPLRDYRDYRSEPERSGELWIVTWRYPVGQLETGEHTVSFRVSWTEPVYDGTQLYGPSTENPEEEGSCVFHVVEP